MHRSGFVNIVGRPNAGKSTLMNGLIGERMSIITAKPQTTRHRIFGIVTGEDYQIVFSDTPGVIEEPHYKMQEMMNRYVNTTFQEEYSEDDLLVGKFRHNKVPLYLVFNKVDLMSATKLKEVQKQFKKWVKPEKVFLISALKGDGVPELLAAVKDQLTEGPKYFPDEELTDRSERFFVSEIIREQILEQYHQEIPYSVEVDIESFQDSETKDGVELARISALIYVSRKSQKPIIIGKGGQAIKELGSQARKRMEEFLQRKVFLELHVKIREDWRDDEDALKRFGYER
jgi:GTP-binding protein Era